MNEVYDNVKCGTWPFYVEYAGIDYLVIAGGGSGGSKRGGGGGAGGYRESAGTSTGCYTVSPFGSGVAALTLQGCVSHNIVIGAGGACAPCSQPGPTGNPGSDSVFATITSAGGGAGAMEAGTGGPGGSGGGAGNTDSAPTGSGGTATPPGQGMIVTGKLNRFLDFL